jgi:hypothetical protein
MKNLVLKAVVWAQLNKQMLAVFLAVCFVNILAADSAFAQQGGSFFEQAACSLLYKVMQKDFGAMVTALAGLFAIIASAAGAYKGAWALVFVSVGCFIYPAIVEAFFPGLKC